MLRTVQLLPQKGFRHWASTRTVSNPSRQSATGPPDSYPDRTHTGKRRRARTNRSPRHEAPPVPLGARTIEVSLDLSRVARVVALTVREDHFLAAFLPRGRSVGPLSPGPGAGFHCR
jgi:hypothetical protein